MSDPNYQQLSPPDEKAPTEYSYTERRAELFEFIEAKGSPRQLERSYRDLGDRYGVSHTTIRKDINTVVEWAGDALGDGVDGELRFLRLKAVQQLLDEGKYDKAYYLMKFHYEMLMEAGFKDSSDDELNINMEDPGDLYTAALDAAHDETEGGSGTTQR